MDHAKYGRIDWSTFQVDNPEEEYCSSFNFARAPDNHIYLAELAIEAQNRNMLEWEDPNILPADLAPGKPNLKGLVRVPFPTHYTSC